MKRLCARRARGAVLLGLIVTGVTAWAGSGVSGDEVPEWVLDRVRSDHDWDEVFTLDLIQAMELSRQQALALLPIHERACEAWLASYEDREELQPEMIKAFTAFLEEDRLNQGFSREVERRTARVNHRFRERREAHERLLVELEQEAAEILSEDQLEVIESYRPNRRAITRRVRAGMSRQEQRGRAERRRLRDRENPFDPLVTAREELKEIARAIHPQAGRIARFLLSPAAADVLYLRAGADQPDVVRRAAAVWRNGTATYPLEECRADEEVIRRLRSEINNWNLANGMHFSRDQIAVIVPAAEQAEELKQGRRRTGKDRSRVRPQERNTIIRALEREVESVLNAGQREVLAAYKSCLIPPKDLKDPVRVGQANDGSKMTRWLERARRANGPRLVRIAERLLDREAEHFGPLCAAERAGRLALLVSTAREARQMSDTEFELSKDELAERIIPVDRREELQAEIARLQRQRGLPGKTAKLLLNKQFAAVLRMRDEQLAKGIVPRPANLAKGPQAENCDKSCALPR